MCQESTSAIAYGPGLFASLHTPRVPALQWSTLGRCCFHRDVGEALCTQGRKLGEWDVRKIPGLWSGFLVHLWTVNFGILLFFGVWSWTNNRTQTLQNLRNRLEQHQGVWGFGVLCVNSASRDIGTLRKSNIAGWKMDPDWRCMSYWKWWCSIGLGCANPGRIVWDFLSENGQDKKHTPCGDVVLLKNRVPDQHDFGLQHLPSYKLVLVLGGSSQLVSG